MLSFAGVPLALATTEIALAIEQRISPRDIFDFSRTAWPGKNRVNWTFPGSDKLPKVRPGVLHWPRDASRWAIGYYLCTTNQLNAIQQVMTAQGYSAQSLILSQENAAGITVNSIAPYMWMLPARPLFQITGRNGLHLLTLVDDRYWWWFRDTGDIAVTPGTTTWSDLYTSLGEALGITIVADSISSSYLEPAATLTSRYEQSPLMLDAVAYNVGQRIVVGLDGDVSATNVATAQAAVAANLAVGYPVMGGGKFAFTPGITNNLPGVLPGSVRLTFPQFDASGALTGDVYALTTTLASLGLADLGNVGNANTKTFHDTCAASGTGTPSNNAELLSLCQQFATDWYRYQAAPVDVNFVGIIPWAIEGLSDAVEWTYRKNEVSTRISRPAWNDLTEELLHGSATETPPSSSDPDALAVLDHAGTVVDAAVVSIKADPLLKLTWSELSAGNVQTIIDSGAIIWNGGTTVLLPGAPTWDLVGFVFNFISSTGGYFNFGAPLEICSSLYWCCTTATLVSASVNNYVLPSNKPVFNLTAVSGGSALTGIVSTQVLGVTGPQVIVINNVGADPIIINHNSASSLAANRILLPPTYGSAVTLAQNDSCILWYDTCTSACWRMIECTVDPDAGATDVDTACDTYAFLSSSEHDVVLPTATASIMEINVTAFAGGTTVDGFVPQTLTTGPQIITLINTGTDGVTISTATGSVAANRIVLPPTYSGLVVLAQDDTITLWYDSCAASPRWYVLACTVDPDAGGTASTSIATLGTSFTVPTTAMSNIGLSISLPSAGNYVLMANIHGLATPPAGPPLSANIQAQLHDGTSIVTDSQTEVMNIETGTGNFEATAPITVPYTATGAVTINVQAVGQTTTGTPMKIAANATTFGHTRIMYLKLS